MLSYPQNNPGDLSDARAPRLTYIVIKAHDIDSTALFYSNLGLSLQEERHGSGPIHYSFEIAAGVVCEIYPSSDKALRSNGLRLGFSVTDLKATYETLTKAGFTMHRELATTTPSSSFVALDPDGNQVEITGVG